MPYKIEINFKSNERNRVIISGILLPPNPDAIELHCIICAMVASLMPSNDNSISAIYSHLSDTNKPANNLYAEFWRGAAEIISSSRVVSITETFKCTQAHLLFLYSISISFVANA